jgi:hypothetical protein
MTLNQLSPACRLEGPIGRLQALDGKMSLKVLTKMGETFSTRAIRADVGLAVSG